MTLIKNFVEKSMLALGVWYQTKSQPRARLPLQGPLWPSLLDASATWNHSNVETKHKITHKLSPMGYQSLGCGGNINGRSYPIRLTLSVGIVRPCGPSAP